MSKKLMYISIIDVFVVFVVWAHKNPNPAPAKLQETSALPEAVSYKIKQFEKSGLICKYFLLLDYKKVGTRLYKILLYLKTLDERREKDLTAFVAMNPYVFDYTRTLAPWQMEIDLEAKDQEHCHQLVAELVNRFKDVVKDHQTLYLLKEHKFLYCPLC